MAKLVTEFPSKHGPVWVEVDSPKGQGPQPVGRGADLIKTASQSFEQSLAGIRPIAEAILMRTTELAQAPKGVKVCFGIKISGEVGVILASSRAEAHVEVTLSWERDA